MKKPLFIIIPLVVLALGWWAYYYFQSNGAVNKTITVDKNVSDCQNLMLSQLKSPSSAKFSNIEKASDDLWQYVRGSVDSQNSFWAMLRTDFVCVRDALWKIKAYTNDWEDKMTYDMFSSIPFNGNSSMDSYSTFIKWRTDAIKEKADSLGR